MLVVNAGMDVDLGAAFVVMLASRPFLLTTGPRKACFVLDASTVLRVSLVFTNPKDGFFLGTTAGEALGGGGSSASGIHMEASSIGLEELVLDTGPISSFDKIVSDSGARPSRMRLAGGCARDAIGRC